MGPAGGLVRPTVLVVLTEAPGRQGPVLFHPPVLGTARGHLGWAKARVTWGLQSSCWNHRATRLPAAPQVRSS